MSTLKYDVATLGNHDFDNGVEGLYKQLPHAKFDFVSANYDLKNNPLDTHVKPYKILVKDGSKLGFLVWASSWKDWSTRRILRKPNT